MLDYGHRHLARALQMWRHSAKEQGRMHQAHVHAMRSAKAFAFRYWLQQTRVQMAHRAIIFTNLQRVWKR